MTDEAASIATPPTDRSARPDPASKQPQKGGTRDGLYQRKDRRGWWISYLDADGRRRRECVATDYRTAVMRRREILSAIARGEILGVRDEEMAGRAP